MILPDEMVHGLAGDVMWSLLSQFSVAVIAVLSSVWALATLSVRQESLSGLSRCLVVKRDRANIGDETTAFRVPSRLTQHPVDSRLLPTRTFLPCLRLDLETWQRFAHPCPPGLSS